MSSDDIRSETTAQGAESESEKGKGEAVVGGGKPVRERKEAEEKREKRSRESQRGGRVSRGLEGDEWSAGAESEVLTPRRGFMMAS